MVHEPSLPGHNIELAADPPLEYRTPMFAAIGGSGSHFLTRKLNEYHELVGEKPDNAERQRYPELWAGPASDEGTFDGRAGGGFSSPAGSLDSKLFAYVSFLRDEPGRTAVFGTAAELGLFSLLGIEGVVFLVRHPLHAYCSWAKPERHGDAIDSLGGLNSHEAIRFYTMRWNRLVAEYLRLRDAGIVGGLIRFEKAPEDARRLGLGYLFKDDFDPGLRNYGKLSESAESELRRRTEENYTLLYGDGWNIDETAQQIFVGLGDVAHDRYGFNDLIGEAVGFNTAGPLAVMTEDQLHPPMVFDRELWADGRRWKDGAVQHVRRAAEQCDLHGQSRVLDIGAGLGGPSRFIANEYGAEVIAMNKVSKQLESMTELNRQLAPHARITSLEADADKPWDIDAETIDCVWSMNMIYHMADHGHFITEAHRVLRPGGRLMLDDWMFTPFVGSDAVETMKFHFGSGNLLNTGTLFPLLEKAGFTTRWIFDAGAVGRTLMRENVDTVVMRDFLPHMEVLSPEWGLQTALDFVDSINRTVDLYETEQMTYMQLVAVRSDT